MCARPWPSTWDELPIPDGPLLVGLDGGIVRARRDATNAKDGHLFVVIAGKSILSFRRADPEDVPPSSKCFAFVQTDDAPGLYYWTKSQPATLRRKAG